MNELFIDRYNQGLDITLDITSHINKQTHNSDALHAQNNV